MVICATPGSGSLFTVRNIDVREKDMMPVGKLLGWMIAVGCAGPTFGGVTLAAEEVGDDVVISGGGTLDTSLWTFLGPGVQMPGVEADAVVAIGPEGLVDLYIMPVGFSGPDSIGPGTTPFFADSSDGDALGVGWVPFPIIAVPTGYVSGDPLTGSESTFVDHSLDSLGLAEGRYTWTWETAAGGSDFFTINIVPAPGAVAVAGLFALASGRRRR